MTDAPDKGGVTIAPRLLSAMTMPDGGNLVSRPDAPRGSKQNGAFIVTPVTVSIADARVMSGLSTATLYRLMDRGELDSVKVGTRRLVKVDSIKRLVGAA